MQAAVTTPGLPLLYPAKIIEMRRISLDALLDKLAAAITKHCGKGRQVLCAGRLQVSTSMDDDTKRIRYHHTIVVSTINFLHDPNRSTAMENQMAA